MGVPVNAFGATSDRFQPAAADGHDPDFHRGETAYDRYVGEADAPHPSLRPLEGPVNAIPVRAGTPRHPGRTAHRRRWPCLPPRRHGRPGPVRGRQRRQALRSALPVEGGTIKLALVFGHLASAAAVSDQRGTT